MRALTSTPAFAARADAGTLLRCATLAGGLVTLDPSLAVGVGSVQALLAVHVEANDRHRITGRDEADVAAVTRDILARISTANPKLRHVVMDAARRLDGVTRSLSATLDPK